MKFLSITAVLFSVVVLAACSNKSPRVKQEAQPSINQHTQLAQTPISKQHIENVTENLPHPIPTPTINPTQNVPVNPDVGNRINSINDLHRAVNQAWQQSQMNPTLPTSNIPSPK